MIILIDNYDSFTYNIYHYIMMCGKDCRIIRDSDSVLEQVDHKDVEGVVLSPGPERPENHPILFEILKKYYRSKPILGICLGYQAIGEFFGAKLVKAPVPVHGKVSNISHTGHVMYKNIPESIFVARYHSLVLEDLEKTELIITSFTKDGLPMSFSHKTLPLWGLQFHPEAIQTENGLQMLKNWTSILS